MFNILIIVVVAVCLGIFFYLKRPGKAQLGPQPGDKEKTPSYVEDIMENIKRTENMEKNNVSQGKDASNGDDRINQICAAIDKKLIEFNGSILEIEKWIKASVKTTSDAYHAGFYLSQIQTQIRLDRWAEIMVFGAPGAEPEETEEETVFEEVPKDQEPVKVTPVTGKETDAIDDFLKEKDKQKTPGKTQAGPEVA
jgi:uncharacterized protein (UPF0333 family)